MTISNTESTQDDHTLDYDPELAWEAARMRIEHIALWTKDLERMRDFYERFFGGKASAKYANPRTGFESYFLAFDSGARIEIMRMESNPISRNGSRNQHIGYAHIAFSVGSRQDVNDFTEELRQKGCPVVSEARVTGDGYYESCVVDPEGNRIEIIE